MQRWLAVARTIDRLTDKIGTMVSWLVVLMVLIGAYNAVARYLGRFLGANLSSNLYLELQWYLFSVLFLLGAAYALKQDAHVRVDVLLSRLSAKWRAWINILGTVLFLIPFTAFAIWLTWPAVRNSWAVHEASPDPGGLPRYPLKAVILLGLALLLLQGVAELIKEIAKLRGAMGETPHRPPTHDGVA
ncbi:MAG TPA: TRAP transporter small permease subunit [Gemmatimonadales bacterium]|nr:TRAP transporter small permease subunit [Gemmatimonadales bacterium]